jgi:hypothetical protein
MSTMTIGKGQHTDYHYIPVVQEYKDILLTTFALWYRSKRYIGYIVLGMPFKIC